MKYEKSKVVMLPTGKVTNLAVINSKPSFYSDRTAWSDGKGKHLYFLPDEEIKENFTGHAIVTVRDDTRIKYLVEVICTEKNQCYTKGGRKFSFEYYDVREIIATTDESLIKKYNGTTPISKDWGGKLLPRPSNEFLKKYCELGGIDEVLVEYGYTINKTMGHFNQFREYKLKVAPDNTITIKPVKKEKTYSQLEVDDLLDRNTALVTSQVLNKFKDTWNREDVIELIRKSHEDNHEHPNDLENWIKENL